MHRAQDLRRRQGGCVASRCTQRSQSRAESFLLSKEPSGRPADAAITGQSMGHASSSTRLNFVKVCTGVTNIVTMTMLGGKVADLLMSHPRGRSVTPVDAAIPGQSAHEGMTQLRYLLTIPCQLSSSRHRCPACSNLGALSDKWLELLYRSAYASKESNERSKQVWYSTEADEWKGTM